ncbi:MAG: hypothetical protein LBJ70_04740 [Holosporales bacterium]|jgi:hypothetical protein|nr:hypothetical protein [Holosporales bacterium]
MQRLILGALLLSSTLSAFAMDPDLPGQGTRQPGSRFTVRRVPLPETKQPSRFTVRRTHSAGAPDHEETSVSVEDPSLSTIEQRTIQRSHSSETSLSGELSAFTKDPQDLSDPEVAQLRRRFRIPQTPPGSSSEVTLGDSDSDELIKF